MAEDKFDGMFLTVANQANGIEPLLDSMFSFLRRKTDFFTGASQEKIENLVLGVIRKHASLSERDQAEKKANALKEEKKKKEREEKKRKVRIKSGIILYRRHSEIVIDAFVFWWCLGGRGSRQGKGQGCRRR
jgi:hypothetical protein